MSLRILLDPVLTAQEPSRCSTYIQYVTLMTRVLENRRDVFFYWPVPDWVAEADMAWLPKHPNVAYLRIPQHKDRTKEYVTLRPEMDRLLAFNGSHWDFDVLITVRTGLVPLMKLVMTSPKQRTMAWCKEVWLTEEMPLMTWKPTVAVMHPGVQDLWTLSGYLGAERVYIAAYHEKDKILQSARQWLAPSRVREIDAKIHPMVPSQLVKFQLKDPKFFFVPGGEQPFCVAYVGRLGASGSNLDKVYRAMTNQWIIRGGNRVRLLVLTVSTGGTARPPDHIELQRAPREEFWRISREEMHCMLCLYPDAQFSLSITEPMTFGVPVILLRKKWSETLFGKDYPFLVDSEMEAYGMLKALYEDYAGMYERFRKWQQEFFVPVFTRRFNEDLLYTMVQADIERYDRETLPKFAEVSEGRRENEVVTAILKHVGTRQELVILEELKALAKAGVLRNLQAKLEVSDRDRRGLVWATGWNDYRLILKAYYGWEDASPVVGHLRRVLS